MLLGWRNGITPPVGVQRRMMSPGMSLNSRNFAVGCQSGPSVNMKPVARRLSSAVAPATKRKRVSRISALTSTLSRAYRLHGPAADVPVLVGDVLEDHPDRVGRQLGDLADRLGH